MTVRVEPGAGQRVVPHERCNDPEKQCPLHDNTRLVLDYAGPKAGLSSAESLALAVLPRGLTGNPKER
jgi:hypothetical protein